MTQQVSIQAGLNPDTFYEQRDSRGQLERSFPAVVAQRIALVVPPNSACPAIGLELALFWTASIIRRMGRPFAEVILVATNEFRQCESRLAHRTMTVEQFISDELRGADPFARIEWRNWADGTEFQDAIGIVWLGSLPLGARPDKTIAINAHGWVAVVDESPASHLSLTPPDFDAAPAAIAMAACIVAARFFAEAFGELKRPHHLAFALDSGQTATDEMVSREWLAKGAGSRVTTPWKNTDEEKPSLAKLLVVSAGGIGGNLCQILGQSHFSIGAAYVVDPDKFEISNLNRAIGVGLPECGHFKSKIASNALTPCAELQFSIERTYESWVTSELAEQFRQTGTGVAVGVDQVRTRLMVGSDWPSMLLNGATSGGTFSSGIHFRNRGGCIGCWYGQDESPYIAARTPMACAAGVAPGTIELRTAASYPFVSVAAAAHMAATLIRAAHSDDESKGDAGTVLSMSLRAPECTQLHRISLSRRCLLLCTEEYVQEPLGRVS